MSLPPLADVEALEVLMAEPLVGPQWQRAALLLGLISAEVRSVTGRAWSDTPRPAVIASTVLKCAERWMRNPGALSNERLGDYGRGWAPDSSPEAGVWLTDAERAALADLSQESGVVSVPTYRPELPPIPVRNGTVYTTEAPGGDAIAWLHEED